MQGKNRRLDLNPSVLWTHNQNLYPCGYNICSCIHGIFFVSWIQYSLLYPQFCQLEINIGKPYLIKTENITGSQMLHYNRAFVSTPHPRHKTFGGEK